MSYDTEHYYALHTFLEDDEGKKIPKQIIMHKLIKPTRQVVPAYQVSQEIVTPLTEMLY